MTRVRIKDVLWHSWLAFLIGSVAIVIGLIVIHTLQAVQSDIVCVPSETGVTCSHDIG